jgi:hypothetical protein
MTKKEEHEALQKFTDSLPAYTYLRPWLESVLIEVEAEIRRDFPVSPSNQKTRVECDRLRLETKQFCEQSRQAVR